MRERESDEIDREKISFVDKGGKNIPHNRQQQTAGGLACLSFHFQDGRVTEPPEGQLHG